MSNFELSAQLRDWCWHLATTLQQYTIRANVLNLRSFVVPEMSFDKTVIYHHPSCHYSAFGYHPKIAQLDTSEFQLCPGTIFHFNTIKEVWSCYYAAVQ